MNRLTQRQSDAVFEVMARFEGFVKAAAQGEHHAGEDCVHCRAQKLLEDHLAAIRGPQAA